MRYKLRTEIFICFLWLTFLLSGSCRAQTPNLIKPLKLPAPPCLVILNNSSYEWGMLDNGVCRGVNGHLSFFPEFRQELTEQILWTQHSIDSAKKNTQCLQASGKMEKLPESGTSNCLCSVAGPNRQHFIGFEKVSADGNRTCQTHNQSFSEYHLARYLDSPVNMDSSPLDNAMGYVIYGTLGTLLTLAISDIWFGVNLVDRGMVFIGMVILRGSSLLSSKNC